VGPPGSSAPSQTRLYTGTKVGVGVGCAAAVTAAAFIVWLLFTRRNRKRELLGNELPTTQMDEPMPVEDKDPHVELADEVV
jgi:hypothetical protein